MFGIKLCYSLPLTRKRALFRANRLRARVLRGKQG